ncbi:MAG: hypothetical protein QNJ46_05895 [Leptolyngbyaceae cyanobacterium MO_188.B28]|nr:hypothetical protein [Leptolyngbyaceae cyanobacterium MO_188.B28]
MVGYIINHVTQDINKLDSDGIRLNMSGEVSYLLLQDLLSVAVFAGGKRFNPNRPQRQNEPDIDQAIADKWPRYRFENAIERTPADYLQAFPGTARERLLRFYPDNPDEVDALFP